MNDLRVLPSVEVVLQNDRVKEWVLEYGRPLTIEAIRSTLDEARDVYQKYKTQPEISSIIPQIQNYLILNTKPTLIPVINATGVILHTNLGRAPLSRSALSAMQAVAEGYSNLEYDLEKGKRGSRTVHAEALLRRLTGAEGALVVNNNASAVLLILTALARRRRVVIARSQLIEIGGGFRVPDVMKQSGAHLVEIGTTNRVHLADYEQALEENPVAFLRAHRSNFSMIGFVEEPEPCGISRVAHDAGIPLIDDLGSGTLLDTEKYGLGHEPTIQESLQAGADLVCFSGDKLLGGPQGGIIVGKNDLVARLKKHPLARAVRADKIALAGFSATLLHYLKDEAEDKIPVWQMIGMSVNQLKERVEGWQAYFNCGELVSGLSTVGGGSLPGETLPTFLLSYKVKNPQAMINQLRNGNPPIVARIEDDCIVCDPRTVLIEQDEDFKLGMKKVLANHFTLKGELISK